MKLTFKVVASNPSNEGKTHVWKLEVNTTQNVFGINKPVKRTFYIGGMPSEGTVGAELIEDIDRFNIVEREFANPETGEVMLLKWLHVKPY